MPFLEQDKRFGKCLLWELQDEAYKNFGVDAWTRAGVPFYITSNSYTAEAYCETAAGYLRDLVRNEMIDFSEPVFFFDLGAGSGRFNYLFWKRLVPLAASIFGKKLKLRLVMTDCVKKNREFWKGHERLKPFFERGELDIAGFRHDQKEPLFLEISGKHLTHLKNPPILIANYFFDTVPQDLFRIQNGKLEEGRITLSSSGSGSVENIISGLKCEYRYAPIADPGTYYEGFPELNRLLLEYLENFRDLTFLLPIGGFESLRYFFGMAGGKLLLISGDQGLGSEEQVKKGREPKIARHGSFSIAVNYHALSAFFSLNGGTAFLPEFPDENFVAAASVLGPGNYPEAQAAFRAHLNRFTPADYWHFGGVIEKDLERFSLSDLLLFLKFGRWDPMNFYAFFPRIRRLAKEASDEEKSMLSSALDLILEEFYPLNAEEGALLQNMGVIAYESGFYSQALQFFERARALMGDAPDLMSNIEAVIKMKKS